MNVTDLRGEEIRQWIAKASSARVNSEQIRMLFVPNHITSENIKETANAYKSIDGHDYNSVVIIESYTGELDKKLAMPSNRSFTTSFGEVPVNDVLRNEFCDEEDDFFIDDEGYSTTMSLFHQLAMLQNTLTQFDAVSLQIGDYDPAIVRELAYVLDELLLGRDALIIFCCDIPKTNHEELERLRALIENNNESGLMHYLNSSDKQLKGARAFMTGVLVAKSWNLEIELLNGIEDATQICGFAKLPLPQEA
ncbi:MAG: AmmeMemoRadiSam system protein B [Bacteroidota bacterium]